MVVVDDARDDGDHGAKRLQLHPLSPSTSIQIIISVSMCRHVLFLPILWLAFATTLSPSVVVAALSLSSGQRQRSWGNLSARTRKWLKLPPSPPSTSSEVSDPEEASVHQEMLRVSFFSFLHSAAMPFADLVDGSFLSTLDANSLGAVGVVRASQVGKLLKPTHELLGAASSNTIFLL